MEGPKRPTYTIWVKTSILQRGHMKVSGNLPRKWETIEDWFFPRFLLVMPTKLKDSIVQEMTYGVEVRVVDLLFRLLCLVQPGSLDEQDQLHKQLCSPNPCKEPAAALKELRRWFGAMTKAVDIGMALPS